MSDASSILIWWFYIFVIGLIFLSLTFSLFKRFADHGYIFSKIVGILLSSYVVWLLANLHLLAFTKLTIFIVLLAFLLINLWLVKNLKDKNLGKKFLALVILEESLFLLTLSFWSYVRAHEPSIRGLEKFMDFGFVNSILRSNFFPPADMWLTRSPDYLGGYFINYYYFGHYVAAFLTKITGLDSATTYNLMIATIFAFTFTLSFSIGMNLYYLFQTIKSPHPCLRRQAQAGRQANPLLLGERKRVKSTAILVGLLAAFLVSLGGNLHTLYTLTSGYPNEEPVPPWKLSLGFHPERYWYPNATRFIPFTIHEFPIYSFVVADLHGHVSDIPFVLLAIAFLLSLITHNHQSQTLASDKRESFANSRLDSFSAEFRSRTGISFSQAALLGVILAVMYMTNAWDGLIYMVLSILVLSYLNLGQQGKISLASLTSTLYKTFSAFLFLLFFFLIFRLQFSLSFKPFVSGIGVLCAPSFLSGKQIGPLLFEAGKCQKSPIYMLAILWGFFYYNVFGFLLLTVIPKIKNAFSLLSPSTVAQGKLESKRNQKRLRLLSFQSLRSVKKLQNFGKLFAPIHVVIHELPPTDIFILIMIFVSTLLLVFPEFFYIKDIYPAHYRANTMFKLGYQAFMMLGLSSSYIFFRAKKLHNGSRIKSGMTKITFYNSFFILLFSLVTIYPYFAINSYYGALKNYHGLYGLNWLMAQYPDDYQAIVWLQKNIQCNNATTEQCNNQPVIVEANGDSYTDYARVSANTGLPTIVGWPVHEWLWRGSYDEAGKRIPEVATIYESKDIDQTKEILRKYSVEYIFVGSLEKEKYKELNEEKISSLGKVVFESGETKIYKVPLL